MQRNVGNNRSPAGSYEREDYGFGFSTFGYFVYHTGTAVLLPPET